MVTTTIDDFVKAFPHWDLTSETTEYFNRLHKKLRDGLQKVQELANESHLGARIAFEHEGKTLATGGHLGGKSLKESLPEALAHALANLYLRATCYGLDGELDYSVTQFEAFRDGYFQLNPTIMFKLMRGRLLEGKKAAGIKVVATVPDEFAEEVDAKLHPLFVSRVVISTPHLFTPEDMYPERPEVIFREKLGHVDKRKIGGAYIIPIVSKPILYN
ncbi:hypothetical protein HYU09_04370 [Candidatus Woesearchaeota archaeon]|nr:hypothetical protein [Candidatus Woesearchaeota archaeon]